MRVNSFGFIDGLFSGLAMSIVIVAAAVAVLW